MQGPYFVKQGYLASIVRVPIFVNGEYERNETFGAPHPPTDCPDYCWSGTKDGKWFWGFAVAVLRYAGMEEDMEFQTLEDAGDEGRSVTNCCASRRAD